jgi:hypothetical protein
MNINESLSLLNSYLLKKKEKRSFIICGGASLLLQGIISRTTKDIDIVAPPIDKVLAEAAISVANELGLDPHWLNCGPETISKELEPGWEKRLIEVFLASNLTVFSISRSDLIFSKFWAFCDRQKDKEDLILLNPTPTELDIAVKLTLTKDGNPQWPEWVIKQSIILKKALKHE